MSWTANQILLVTESIQFSSAQSLDRLGRQGNMSDDDRRHTRCAFAVSNWRCVNCNNRWVSTAILMTLLNEVLLLLSEDWKYRTFCSGAHRTRLPKLRNYSPIFWEFRAMECSLRKTCTRPEHVFACFALSVKNFVLIIQILIYRSSSDMK